MATRPWPSARGRAVLIGSGTAAAAASLTGIATELTVRRSWATFQPGAWAAVLAPLLQHEPAVVLPGSPDGRDLAPRLAALLHRPLYAGAISSRRTVSSSPARAAPRSTRPTPAPSSSPPCSPACAAWPVRPDAARRHAHRRHAHPPAAPTAPRRHRHGRAAARPGHGRPRRGAAHRRRRRRARRRRAHGRSSPPSAAPSAPAWAPPASSPTAAGCPTNARSAPPAWWSTPSSTSRSA